MTCKDVAEFLDQYLGGELPRLQRWIFDAHLALCPDCRNYIAGYKKTIELARQSHNADAASPIPEDLLQAILRSKARY